MGIIPTKLAPPMARSKCANMIDKPPFQIYGVSVGARTYLHTMVCVWRGVVRRVIRANVERKRETHHMQPYIGQILAVGFNYAPIGWAICNGQLMSIAEYSTLYALIGTTYGGDGVSTFALPNLQGRVPLSMGQAPGMPNYAIGQMAGSETVTLTPSQLPSHTHMVTASSAAGTTNTPASNTLLAQNPQSAAKLYAPSSQLTPLSNASIGASGGNQPHENLQPLLAINFIIALEGIYPSLQ